MKRICKCLYTEGIEVNEIVETLEVAVYVAIDTNPVVGVLE